MGIFLALVFFAWILWILAFREAYIGLKYRKPMPISLSDNIEKEELYTILKEKLDYPSKIEIYYDEYGNIAITGKYGVHILTISDENLYISRNNSHKNRNMEEAECLGAYIQKLFDSDAPVNPYLMYKKMTNYGKKRLGITAFLLLFCLVVSLSAIKDSDVDDGFSSNNISSSYLTGYSEDITIGEAFDNFFANGEWKKFSDGSVEYVDYSGEFMLGEDSVNVCIRFWTSDKKFKVESVTIDGEEVDGLFEESLFTKIYENSESSQALEE